MAAISEMIFVKSIATDCILIKLGPPSINRFNDGDDELDVDVEQCSDSEALSRSRTPRTTSNNSRGTTPSPSDDERLTPEPVKPNVDLCSIFLTVIFYRVNLRSSGLAIVMICAQYNATSRQKNYGTNSTIFKQK